MQNSPDRYVLERQIGGGHLSAVFIARDPQGRAVVLKRPASSDAALVANFQREVELLSRVRHPNIVSVLESHAGPDPFYVMPLLEGESLEARVRRMGALPPAEVCRMVAQIASALDALHAQGIVHRDVTPANIMLLQDGRAVLIDFSLATGKLGMRGQAGVGTPLYCAPEQWKGEITAPSADVYGLGGVAYFALCGQPPHKELETAERTAEQHLRKPIRALHEVNPGVSRRVSAVVMRALARESDKRWRTAGVFARQLEAALAEQAQKRRSPLVAVGALLAGLALAVLAAAIWLSLSPGWGGESPQLASSPMELPPFATVPPRRTVLRDTMARFVVATPLPTVTLETRLATEKRATQKPTVTPLADPTPEQQAAAQVVSPTQTPRLNLNLEFRAVSGQEHWGMPTSPDGCSQFDDRQPVWRYKVTLTIRNAGKTALTNWSVKLFNQGKPLNTCLLYGRYDPIPPGQTLQVEVAAFLTADPVVQAHVISGGRTWRLCFTGTVGVPC
ncbi:MAG: serine/threonine protein kinase [Anaerolineales bacterium]|nr:serine/threonine protein kinase [Anaerolineales bacterium]